MSINYKAFASFMLVISKNKHDKFMKHYISYWVLHIYDNHNTVIIFLLCLTSFDILSLYYKTRVHTHTHGRAQTGAHRDTDKRK